MHLIYPRHPPPPKLCITFVFHSLCKILGSNKEHYGRCASGLIGNLTSWSCSDGKKMYQKVRWTCRVVFLIKPFFRRVLGVLVAIAVVVEYQSSLNYEVARKTLSFPSKTVPWCNSTPHGPNLLATTKWPITNAAFLHRQRYIWFTVFSSTTTAFQWPFVT